MHFVVLCLLFLQKKILQILHKIFLTTHKKPNELIRKDVLCRNYVMCKSYTNSKKRKETNAINLHKYCVLHNLSKVIWSCFEFWGMMWHEEGGSWELRQTTEISPINVSEQTEKSHQCLRITLLNNTFFRSLSFY